MTSKRKKPNQPDTRVSIRPNNDNRTIWYNKVDVTSIVFDVYEDFFSGYAASTYRMVDNAHNHAIFERLYPLLVQSGFVFESRESRGVTEGSPKYCIERFAISKSIAIEVLPENNRRASHLLEQEEIK